MAKKPKNETPTLAETAAAVQEACPNYDLAAAMDTQAKADEAANPDPADAEAVLAAMEDTWAREDAERELGTAPAAGDADEGFADWWVGKQLAIKAEIQLLKDQHEKRLRALQGRLNGVTRYGAVRVEAFLLERLAAKGGKGKFIDLPHGRLGLRAKPATVDYSDDVDRVRKFAEDYGPAAEAYAEVQPPPKPSVLIKPLVAAVEQWMQDNGGEEPKGFLYIGTRDAMYVDPPRK